MCSAASNPKIPGPSNRSNRAGRSSCPSRLGNPSVRDGPHLFIPKSPSSLPAEVGIYKPLPNITALDIGVLRQSLLALMPADSDAALLQVAGDVLDDALVSSYFFPKMLEVLPSANRFALTANSPFWIPAVQLSRSITKARALSQPVLKQGEWPLTCLAILLEPCGILHCASFRALADMPSLPMGSESFDIARYLLLSAPLRQLRMQHPGIAGTLAAVLGLSNREDKDNAGHYGCGDSDGGDDRDGFSREQAARVSSVVWLANLRMKGLWAPPEC